MRRVSFQGERGAYSESAAISFFGKEIETVPYATFAEVLNSTESGETGFAMLPVENSLEGSVGESNDLLYYTGLYAVGEIYHKIAHCLIGIGTLDEVKTVYSHPQALGQCRKFLGDHAMRIVPAYDTAGSVIMVKELDRRDAACIASEDASCIHGVPVITRGIADNSENYTRFLVLSKTPVRASGTAKTSIIFSIKHETGALYGIMELFHHTGINLTKIESRPKRETNWEYNFYVDFEGNRDDPEVARMLEKIEERAIFFKILGSYSTARD